MGVRGSDPKHHRVLERTLYVTGFSDPVHRLLRLTLFRPPAVTRRPLMTARLTPPLPPELCNLLSSPTLPRRSVPSCLPEPRSPACAALEPACLRATNPQVRRACWHHHRHADHLRRGVEVAERASWFAGWGMALPYPCQPAFPSGVCFDRTGAVALTRPAGMDRGELSFPSMPVTSPKGAEDSD